MTDMKNLMIKDDPGQDIAIDDCWNRIGVWGKSKPKCSELERVIHCVNCDVYSRAGRVLLDRKSNAQYIAGWQEQIKEIKNGIHKNDVAIVVFRIGNEWLALHAKYLHEVVEMRVMHRVPHAKSTILRGIINIRGELLLCISLGQLLGIEKRSRVSGDGQRVTGARMVVIDNGDDRYVFPVSEVQGIHRYARDNLQEVPTTAGQSMSNYLCGVLVKEDRHIGCLDENAIFSSLKRVMG